MHNLIVGTTQSGKTTLAKQLQRLLKGQGYSHIVLDPNGDHWPDAAFVTENPETFLREAKQWRDCYLWIDEASETCSNHDKEMHWAARRARHLGHSSYFISQLVHDMAKAIRTNSAGLYLFASPLSDVEILAKEWNCAELLNAPRLKQGHFYHVTRFKPVKLYNLFKNQEVSNHELAFNS